MDLFVPANGNNSHCCWGGFLADRQEQCLRLLRGRQMKKKDKGGLHQSPQICFG